MPYFDFHVGKVEVYGGHDQKQSENSSVPPDEIDGFQELKVFEYCSCEILSHDRKIKHDNDYKEDPQGEKDAERFCLNQFSSIVNVIDFIEGFDESVKRPGCEPDGSHGGQDNDGYVLRYIHLADGTCKDAADHIRDDVSDIYENLLNEIGKEVGNIDKYHTDCQECNDVVIRNLCCAFNQIVPVDS